jgi:redox-sensitive bicupin YhaK (pirin superfamily)
MNDPELIRPVKMTWKSQPTLEGAGVPIRRGIGHQDPHVVDPFLLFDDFRTENPAEARAGFPWHPHRGIETITYVLEGDVEHEDSLGNQGVISSGDIQWMTAGNGIIHQEMPKGDRRGRMMGFQLWSNLPRSHKMTDPRYQEVKAAQIPTVKTSSGASVRIVAGEIEGVRGPVRDVVSHPEYLDVSLPAGKSFSHPLPEGHSAFAYVFEGEGYFDPARDPLGRSAAGRNSSRPEGSGTSGDGTVILYGAGNRVVVTTGKKPVRFLLISGKPFGEPIAWYGPIVMNTREELKTAFEEYEKGTFVRKGRMR